MSAPAKQSSRWGFLQQAVAGVEARLDTILAEGPEESQSPKKPAAALTAATKLDTSAYPGNCFMTSNLHEHRYISQFEYKQNE
jgi:hypothetical protein